MFERFTDQARRSVVLAQEAARDLGHSQIGTGHLLLGLLEVPETMVTAALDLLCIDGGDVAADVRQRSTPGGESPPGHIPWAPEGKKALELSLREALQLGHNYIGPEHILLSLIRQAEGPAAEVLLAHGADLSIARECVSHLIRVKGGRSQPAPEWLPLRNLTDAARSRSLGPVVGRQREIRRALDVLNKTSRSPLLVGEHGTGVTSVAHGLAQDLLEPDGPPGDAERAVWTVDAARMARLASTTERRLAAIVARIRRQPGAILFIDNLGAPVRGDSGEPVAAVAALGPMFLSGDLRAIGAMTPGDLDAHLPPGTALSAVFEPVTVAELGAELVVEVLLDLRARLADRHGVEITEGAIAAAAALSAGQAGAPPLPGRAISLLERAVARAAGQGGGHYSRRYQELVRIRSAKDAALDSQNWSEAATLRVRERSLLTSIERPGGGSPGGRPGYRGGRDRGIRLASAGWRRPGRGRAGAAANIARREPGALNGQCADCGR